MLFSSEINVQESSKYSSERGGSGSGSGSGSRESSEEDEDPREAPQVKRGTCERRKRKSCGKMKRMKWLCESDKMPDPCACNPCQKCPSGSKAFRRSASRYSGFKCLRFSACPTSKGNEVEAGASEMNTGELVATIAMNATKLIAGRIIEAMQSIFKKEDND